jgi:putative SOS response-associated peptidase YedK
MCGRYFLQRDPAGLARYFETTNPVPNFAATWNMAPTQSGLVVRRHPASGARHLDVLRWGLVPHWAKDATGAARLMNARDDGVSTKPSFREAFRRRRCLIPMDGFYEWRAEGKAKQPFAVALRTGEPMACAGLWEGWQQPDGTWLRTYTIITTAAGGRQAMVHTRMPVVVPRTDWEGWLSPEAEEADLLALLRPADDALLAFWPVSPRVGRVAENDAGLILRDPMAAPPSELDNPPPTLD